VAWLVLKSEFNSELRNVSRANSYQSMKISKIVPMLVAAVLLTVTTASAVPVGSPELLGRIIPGTPADPANAAVMVNFLVDAYNFSPTARSLGDNPNDPQLETYYLSPGGSVPAGPLGYASLGGALAVTTQNTTLDLGTGGFTYITAKFGQDSEVFYVGGLAGQITLANLTGNHNGLSGYVLFGVPDGGPTIALLGLGCFCLGFVRRRMAA